MKGAGRRVAITGYGVVAPCGIGKKAFWDGLNGPGITDHRSIEIPDWDPLPYFDNPKEARRADRVEQMALAAAAEALEHSGRPERRFGPHRHDLCNGRRRTAFDAGPDRSDVDQG